MPALHIRSLALAAAATLAFPAAAASATPSPDCTGGLTTDEGTAASRELTGADADAGDRVVSLTIADPRFAIGPTTAEDELAGTPARAVFTVPAGVPAGTYDVAVTATDDKGATGSCTLVVGVRGFTPIADVQGGVPRSPLLNQRVRIRGTVTGIDNEKGTSSFPERERGLYVQDTTGGVFVGEPGVDPTTFAPGDVVVVEGIVREVFNNTTVDAWPGAGGSVVVTGTAPLPEPVVITQASTTGYEALEGVRVAIARATAVSGGTNKFDELFVLPGDEGTNPLVRTDGDARKPIALDEDAGEDDPANPRRDETPSTTVVQADQFDTVRDIVGPVHFAFSTYRVMVQPGALPTVVDGPTPYPFAGLPAAGDDELRVVFYNVENFFPVGGELDGGTVTEAEFETKRERLANAIGGLLRRPDVVGLQEVVDLPTLQALATRLGGYTAHLEEGNDNRGIDVGFLIKDGVTVHAVTQIGKEATESETVRCSDVAGRRFDRPPLVADVEKRGVRFAAIVNHWSSKAAPNRCRELQAEFVRDHVAGLEAAGREVVVGGDLNAFEDESPLAVLQSAPATLDNLVDDDAFVPAEQRYSFAFRGLLQVLDHALVTDGLRPRVRAAQFAHIGNDYHDRGGTDGHKASDHDAVVVTLALPVAPKADPSAPPAIDDTTPAVGDVLTAFPGVFTGSPAELGYEWLRCAKGVCAPIAGATGQTYVVSESDRKHTVAVRVTATNGAGSDSATSAETERVRKKAKRDDDD